MSPRVSFHSMGAVCVLAGAAYAQTAPVPSRPAPPLTVPIRPAPLDEQTQSALDANTPRTFQVQLKYVSPSLMAFWLDPKNHAEPASSRIRIGERELVTPRKISALPVGVDRIVPVDPQKVLLVYGTSKAMLKLQGTIDLLDKPLVYSIVATPQVAFDSAIYWLDSLAPTAKEWQNAAPLFRTAHEGEVKALDEWITADRATRQALLPLSVGVGTRQILSFAPASPNFVPPTPNYRRGDNHYPMPRLNGNPEIDPGIQTGPLINEKAVRGQLHLTPFVGGDGALYVSTAIAAPELRGLKPQFVLVRDGETMVLSGSAKEMGLVPPSPRFDSFVLCVTPHIVKSAPLPAVPEPAK